MIYLMIVTNILLVGVIGLFTVFNVSLFIENEKLAFDREIEND